MVTNDQLIELLRIKHSKDVFVTECKNGPTYFSRMRRMDVWTMRRSWSDPRITAYEIKTSRADFLRDKKWRDYLEYCTQFYFVCPWGMIDPCEIESPAGLIYASKKVSRLYIKKRAPVRHIRDPIGVWMYILMARAIIVTPIEQWKYGYGGLILADPMEVNNGENENPMV